MRSSCGLDFANCDHEASAHAIAKGLTKRAQQGLPAYWIHTSGSLILGTETHDLACFGDRLDRVYNDWDGVKDLMSLPDHAAHRNVDKIVIACSQVNPNVKTAIVCPPTIYGTGRGADNKRSVQAYQAAEAILKRGKGLKVGSGENIWHEVHVWDLSELYRLLGEAAEAGGPPATWNEEGYYLAENGSFEWGDILTKMTEIAYKKGLLPTAEVESLPAPIVHQIKARGQYRWGTNSRGISVRGKKLLGWKPVQHSLEAELPEIVDFEAKALELVQGHAAKVTQD